MRYRESITRAVRRALSWLGAEQGELAYEARRLEQGMVDRMTLGVAAQVRCCLLSVLALLREPAAVECAQACCKSLSAFLELQLSFRPPRSAPNFAVLSSCRVFDWNAGA